MALGQSTDMLDANEFRNAEVIRLHQDEANQPIDNLFFSPSQQQTPTFSAGVCSDTIKTGSFLINMGISPQTVSNGLKPYGLLYDLTMNYGVPIVWSINPLKSKDGSDFTHNGVTYMSGVFIVPAQFISPAVQSRITFWQAQGVSGNYSVASLMPPIYDTITCFPRIMIDNNNNNQGLLIAYYNNASIPASAFSVGTPSALSTCYDIWTAPHSDPTWATHSFLYNFVTVRKGWVWAGCHSVSILESCQNPSFPFNSLRFLTTTGLQCYNSGSCNGITSVHPAAPTAPFTYFYPADPVMQFMGPMDPASQNGSERWYIPLASGQWLNTTKRSVTTSDGISPREGVEIAYGPAFGNPNNGMAMYEGGHSLDGGGTVANQVAAQRAYFNYILQAGIKTRLNISIIAPTTMTAGSSFPVSVGVSNGVTPYTYSWSSTTSGTFSNPTSASPTFTPSPSSTDTIAYLKVQSTDACGRKNTNTICVKILAGGITLPVTLLNFSARKDGSTALLSWTTSSEINNDFFEIERSKDGDLFQSIGIVRGNGNSTSLINYTYADLSPYSGISYYRLAQSDFDGRKTLSNVAFLNMKEKAYGISNLQIFPSPVQDKLTVLFNSDLKTNALITIYNALGNIIFKEKVMVNKGDNLLRYSNLEQLESGIYFLNMTLDDGQVKTINFAKF